MLVGPVVKEYICMYVLSLDDQLTAPVGGYSDAGFWCVREGRNSRRGTDEVEARGFVTTASRQMEVIFLESGFNPHPSIPISSNLQPSPLNRKLASYLV